MVLHVMQQMRSLRAGIVLACALAAAPAMAPAAEVTIFAAASLKTALDAALSAFERETGTETVVSYGGSSALARQIQLGAPADLFVSANPDWMDVLDRDGLLAPDSRHDLFGNRLVVVASAPGDGLSSLEALPEKLGEGRLAMALVTAVPAGIYGKAALEAAGVWERIAPRVAQTDNVRAALALTASGATPFGIVYASDARAEPKVSVALEIAPELHPAIIYPIARLSRSETPQADAVLRYLQSPQAAPHFTAQGFLLLPE